MKEKILIVEDNLRNMRLMELLLRGNGYTLLKATDGEEALEVAVREHPDLILMDIQLPGLNGLEATRQLRQMPAFSHIPILAITAYAMGGDKEKFIDADFDAYLSKPINTRELREMITDLLGQRTDPSVSTNSDRLPTSGLFSKRSSCTMTAIFL